jgi:multidrug resistance protein, MATE family
LYMVTWKFLAAQNVMMPLVIVGVFCCAVILPVSLDYSIQWFGFLGSAVAIGIFQAAQALLTLLYIRIFQPHHAETWPSLAAWREALQWEPLCTYFSLGMGGMVATSEWIYWEIISLAIGTLGVTELSIHTVATQAILVTFMIPFGIGIALSIRLGAIISQSVHHAQTLTVHVYIWGTMLFAAMSILLYAYRDSIFHWFTSDVDVIVGCHAIWWKVCFYLFHLGIYALNMGVSTGLGMQWTLGVVTFVFLWIFGLPAALYLGVAKYHSLGVVWDLIWPPYMFANAVLMAIFLSKDWKAIHLEVRRREGLERSDSGDDDAIEATVVYGSVQVVAKDV